MVDTSETTDDLVWDVVEVLTSRGCQMCARRSGWRGARNRVMRAVTATAFYGCGEAGE